MSILLLAQDGRLTLEDRIDQYLPTFKGKDISLRELLIHTSGLGNPLATVEYANLISPQIVTGPEWAIAHSSTMPLAFRPGEKAEYDNTGYVALARVVEHVSGMSLDRFLRTRIFDVVGMKKEHPYQYLAIQKNDAVGYSWWQKDSLPLVPNGTAGRQI